MKGIFIFLLMLLFLSSIHVYAQQDDLWQKDFSKFIEAINEAAKKSAEEHNGDVHIEDLNKIFLNKNVTWTGTLKYVHKERPYFKDSFIEIDPVTSMSCVMYYPAEDSVSSWEQQKSGSKITYTGKISSINVDRLSDDKLFPYIDLVDVRPAK